LGSYEKEEEEEWGEHLHRKLSDCGADKLVHHMDNQGEKKNASGYGKNLRARRQGLDVVEHGMPPTLEGTRWCCVENNAKTCHT